MTEEGIQRLMLIETDIQTLVSWEILGMIEIGIQRLLLQAAQRIVEVRELRYIAANQTDSTDMKAMRDSLAISRAGNLIETGVEGNIAMSHTDDTETKLTQELLSVSRSDKII
jgi:ABC-type dipeptide/oligopeptide/nickel transport system ATPase subunit